MREVTETGKIKVVKISSLDNPANMFTKVLPINKLHHCLNLIGMKEDTEAR